MNYQTELKEFYARADFENAYEQRWGYGNAVAAEYWRMRDTLVLNAIRGAFGGDLKQLRVLEIGTGFGHELAKLERVGFRARNLTGIDLLENRIQRARTNYPKLTFCVADAVDLPFASQSFDVVMQFTCVMHALTPAIQEAICVEMSRVLSLGGLLVWWDLAPMNWRTLCFRRLLLSTKGSLRQAVHACAITFKEIISPPRRRQATHEAFSGRTVVTDVADLTRLFNSLDLKATRAGVHFDVWKTLWRPSPGLARLVWRTAWFSTHCFAVAQRH